MATLDENEFHDWHTQDMHAMGLASAAVDVFADTTTTATLDHDDVHQLFPMLSDSSLDDLTDEGSPLFGSMPALDHDLVPILESFSAPPPTDKVVTTSDVLPALTTEQDKHNFTATTMEVPTEPRKPTTLVKATTPKRTPSATKRRLSIGNTSDEQPTVSSSKRRPRTASAVSREAWTDQEQSVFFSIFKSKWPDPQSIKTPNRSATQQLELMWLERFQTISNKLKTKSVEDVCAFYLNTINQISKVLALTEHDIDLTNPDEIRIAVWCWSKLLTDETHRQALQTFESQTVQDKSKLATVLVQSIIRSRRQMLKSKCTIYSYYTSTSNRKPVDPTSKPYAPVAINNFAPKEQEAQEPKEPKEHPEPSQVVVHHPLVRKKPRMAVQLGKRMTVQSPSTTPKKNKLLLTPETLSSPTDLSRQFQTPPSSSRKKIYIKLRMVPKNKETKALVAGCGCNPKVELKLSSSKTISDVVEHMTRKWSAVQTKVAATAQLRFFPKDQAPRKSTPETESNSSEGDEEDDAATGWGATDTTVTCLDMWRQCTSKTMDAGDNVLVVSYAWQVIPATQPQSTPSLQQFGTSMAFETSNLLDLMTPERLRRRITPMLVSKQECNI